MNFFYHPDLEAGTDRFVFSPEESRHIVKVLRRNPGDVLDITNGRGMRFSAEILEADPRRCAARVRESFRSHPEKFRLHLAVAPTRKPDRYEWFLEKATEIGVDRITPIRCAHSERDRFSMDRSHRVIQEAMKQSLRTYLPELESPVTFAEFLKRDFPGLRFIAHCEPEERTELKRLVAPDKDILILIGPEGDFSPEEIRDARASGFRPVSLGPSRLRTETAAVVACTTVNLINRA